MEKELIFTELNDSINGKLIKSDLLIFEFDKSKNKFDQNIIYDVEIQELNPEYNLPRSKYKAILCLECDHSNTACFKLYNATKL